MHMSLVQMLSPCMVIPKISSAALISSSSTRSKPSLSYLLSPDTTSPTGKAYCLSSPVSWACCPSHSYQPSGFTLPSHDLRGIKGHLTLCSLSSQRPTTLMLSLLLLVTKLAPAWHGGWGFPTANITHKLLSIPSVQGPVPWAGTSQTLQCRDLPFTSR